MFDRIAASYHGCTAVVIGAGGIGSELARRLNEVARGVIVADANECRLKQLEATCQSARLATSSLATDMPTTNVLATRTLDVRDSRAVEEFFESVEAAVGSLDFVFYTAGVLNVEPFSELSSELWQRAIEINLNGAFYCAKAAVQGSVADSIYPVTTKERT